jgi:hypothetical protein
MMSISLVLLFIPEKELALRGWMCLDDFKQVRNPRLRLIIFVRELFHDPENSETHIFEEKDHILG